MTQLPASLEGMVKLLATEHERPNQMHLGIFSERLRRMKSFYEDKVELAPVKQGKLFMGFAASIKYALELIEQYDVLTQQLAVLADNQAVEPSAISDTVDPELFSDERLKKKYRNNGDYQGGTHLTKGA